MNLTLALVCTIAVMSLSCGRCKAAPSLIPGIHRDLDHRPHTKGYAMEGFVKDLMEDLIGEDEDTLRLSKRQNLDDYGHMRFGKRSNGANAEYGYSRLSRNIE